MMNEAKSPVVGEGGDASRTGRVRGLYLMGQVALNLGTVYTTMAVMNQNRNTVPGRHYFDWITVGVIVAFFGLVCVLFSRSTRTQIVSAVASAVAAAVLAVVLATVWPALLGRG